MARIANSVPVYREHKSTHQGVITVRLANGRRKDIYLGKYGTSAAKAEYARIVTLLAASGGIYPSATQDLTVNEGLVRFLRFACGYYVNPDGTPSKSLESVKLALGYLKRLHGTTLLAEFGPPELKAIRELMIKEGRVRRQINKHAGTVRLFFRWCVEEQLVPASVWDTLRALRPLAPGRGGVVEGTPREPADPAAVEASLNFMSPAVKAIVLLLRLTGARPTEILQMTTERIDRTGEVWKYSPLRHKTAWKGKTRVVYFGPEAQTVLSSWIDGVQPGEHIFSPTKSDAMRMALRSAIRKTPRYPSHMKRNEQKRVGNNRKRPPAVSYDHLALSRAVNRACKRAGVAAYSPYCLRHLRAVELREKFGLESVRAVLGQSSMAMAEHYARRADDRLATAAAAEIG